MEIPSFCLAVYQHSNMSHRVVVLTVCILVTFFEIVVLDTTRCLFPRGILDGQCVECPVDTLYEYIESITTQKTYYWPYTVTTDNSYHKCVRTCSQKNPIIGSQRTCTRYCPSQKRQRGKISYCQHENINNGFCKRKRCQSSELQCYYMKCFEKCPDFTVSYKHSCVIECFEDQPFIFLGKCVTHCPENHVLETVVCKKSCSIGRYLSNKTCVRECPKSQQYVNELKCVSRCPDQKMIQENFCVNNCSENYVLDINKCVKICPESRKYIDDKTCVKSCPPKKMIQGTFCLNDCSENYFLDGNACVKKCPESHQLINNRNCVGKCPDQKKIQDFFCVNQCSENYFLDGQMCKKECPVNLFEHNRKCVKYCPNNTLIENHTCVLKCSPQLLQSKSQCLSECPSGHFIIGSNQSCTEHCNGVIYHNKSKVFCLQECPDDTADVNSTCVTDCPTNQPFFFLKKCVPECPTETRFVSKIIGPDNTLRYVCVHKCTKYISTLSNMCVDACSFDEVLFGSNCQETCPSSDPFPVHLPETSREKINLKTSFQNTGQINAFVICAQVCPSTFVIDNEECYPECPHSERNMMFNSNCFTRCPETDPFVLSKGKKNICTYKCPKLRFEKQCVDKCPKSNMSIVNNECITENCSQIRKFEDGELCVDKCEIVSFKNKCYNTCPPNAKYVYNGTCVTACPVTAAMMHVQYFGLYSLNVCSRECPTDKFIFDNHCVSKCPDSKRLPINGTCTACHDVSKFDDGTKCVDFCPYIQHDFQCLEFCPPNFKNFNNTCVRNCPFESPIESYFQNNYNSLWTLHCAASCGNGQYRLQNRCVSTCDGNLYSFNESCVEICPKAAPFMSKVKSKHGFVLMVECLHHCKDTDFSLDFTCYEKCPQGYSGYKQLCLRRCPSNFPYIYKNKCVKRCKTLRQGTNCFDKCPTGTFLLVKNCVRICPSIKPYAYKKQCVKNCPGYVIKKKCYEQCPAGLVGYKKKCNVSCPSEAKFTYNWECVATCPSKTIINPFHFTCLDTCPIGKFKFQRRCLNKCPQNFPYVFKNECVSTCSGYLEGDVCRNKCANGQYSFKGKCISKCPDEAKFVIDQKCVTSCPSAPKTFHRYGSTCKAGCPPLLPFLAMFGTGCVEKCDFYELASEDYKCIPESDCSGFIDDIWCRPICPEHTYILLSGKKKLCNSLLPAYAMIPVLSLFVISNVVFVIRVLYHYCTIRPRKKQDIFELEGGHNNEETKLLVL